MQAIKKLISIFITVAVVISIMVVMSIYGEKDHQESCEKLGINCEKGRVQEFSDQLWHWAKKKAEEVKKASSN